MTSTEHSVRRLRLAITAGLGSTADEPLAPVDVVEGLVREVAASIFAHDDDPRQSFKISDGFLLTSSYQLLAEKQTQLLAELSGSEPERAQALQEKVRRIDALRTVLATLVPTGRAGIVAADVPKSVAGKLLPPSWTQQLADVAARCPALKPAVDRAQKWIFVGDAAASDGKARGAAAKDDADMHATSGALLQVLPAIAAALPALVKKAAGDAEGAAAECVLEDPSGLQLLLYVVSVKLEWLLLQDKALRGQLTQLRDTLAAAVVQLEAALDAHGTLRPYLALASLWCAQRGACESTRLTRECMAVMVHAQQQRRARAPASLAVKETAAAAAAATRRRQRQEDEDDHGKAEEGEEGGDRNERKLQRSEINWQAFERQMKEHIATSTAVTQAAREDFGAGLEMIAGEIDFDGASSTARDVDRVVPLLRNGLFNASPFDGRAGQPSSLDRMLAVAFDRQRRDESAEARTIVPCQASLDVSSPFVDIESATNASCQQASNNNNKLSALERVAVELAKQKCE